MTVGSGHARWRPGWTALALLLAAGYVTLGLSRVSFDVDITRLLPPGLKESAGYRLFLENFAGADELIVALEGPDAAAVEEVAGLLARELPGTETPLARRVIWRSPFDPQHVGPPSRAGEATEATEAMEEMDATQADADASSFSADLLEFLAWALLNRPPDEFADLERRIAPGRLEATLEEGLEALATSLDGSDRLMGYDPLGLAAPLLRESENARDLAPSLASPDGRFRLVFVESARPLPDYRATGEWLAAVRAAAEAVATPRGVSVRFTGEPAFVSEISRSMEHDMKLSGGLALALICLIVWFGYRDLRLLPLLAVFVALIFVLTISTAGLLAGRLTVLTVGCGSILIGLTVDYGVLLYAAGGAGAAADAMRRTRRGILWAAASTAASFAALVFCGLPGLAELGILVTIGVLLGAGLFLFVYPRVLEALALHPPRTAPWPAPAPPPPGKSEGRTGAVWLDRALPGLVALMLAGGLAGLAVRGVPKLDLDSGSLRPRVSEAYDTLDRLGAQLGGGEQSLSILVAGRDESEVAARLAGLEERLDDLRERGVITSFTLPRALWPDPAVQQANLLGPARRIAAEEARLRAAVSAAGFSGEAFSLTAEVLAWWRQWAAAPDASATATASASASATGPPHDPVSAPAGTQPETNARALWPEGPAARWLLARFAAPRAAGHDPAARSLCLGIVRPRLDPGDPDTMAALGALQTDGVYLAGSRLVGRVIEQHLARGFFWLAVVFGSVTLGLLAVVLRRPGVFLLVCLSLALALGALLGAMAWLGLGWNSFTLPALLLCLGTGSDYYIYVTLDLQDHGSVERMRARLVRPLLVCAGSSVCGFGSLAWAGNVGLASLGRVCALAIAINLLVALFLVPVLWRWARGRLK